MPDQTEPMPKEAQSAARKGEASVHNIRGNACNLRLSRSAWNVSILCTAQMSASVMSEIRKDVEASPRILRTWL
eukprot:6463694-Amphidinium_carterae.1